MKHLNFMNEDLQIAIEHLNKGSVILYPTDTIWGLGCDPTNQQAVDRIFSIKNRNKDKPLIMLVDSIERLSSIVPKIYPHLENILHYNERPLTIIFPRSTIKWADGITADNGSIAIRIVKNDFCKKLISIMDKPLVSTSANISSDNFPTSFYDIHPDIREAVDHIVPQDYDQHDFEALPSLVAKYSTKQKELVFLRQ